MKFLSFIYGSKAGSKAGSNKGSKAPGLQGFSLDPLDPGMVGSVGSIRRGGAKKTHMGKRSDKPCFDRSSLGLVSLRSTWLYNSRPIPYAMSLSLLIEVLPFGGGAGGLKWRVAPVPRSSSKAALSCDEAGVISIPFEVVFG